MSKNTGILLCMLMVITLAACGNSSEIHERAGIIHDLRWTERRYTCRIQITGSKSDGWGQSMALLSRENAKEN